MKRVYLFAITFLISNGVFAQLELKDICSTISEGHEKLLPNPENCNSYIQCVHKKPVVINCPEGLHWNSNANICDWPEAAKCETVKSKHTDPKSNLTPSDLQKYKDCSGVPDTINVLLPNPKNCSSYIQCVHRKPMIMPCPAGLHWSVSTNRCDWPQIAKCKVRNSCEGVPESQDVLLPNPENCSTYIQCVHQKPVVRSCPSGLNWNDDRKFCDWPRNTKCANNSSKEANKTITNPSNESLVGAQKYKDCKAVPDTINVLLPNPKNCSSYIQCVHRKPVIMPCPAGLHWSVSTNRCDWPQIAKCQVRNSCEGVPESQDVLLPNPENCSTYIQCVHQKPVVRSCPSGLNWNDDRKFCDWPQNTQCIST